MFKAYGSWIAAVLGYYAALAGAGTHGMLWHGLRSWGGERYWWEVAVAFRGSFPTHGVSISFFADTLTADKPPRKCRASVTELVLYEKSEGDCLVL